MTIIASGVKNDIFNISGNHEDSNYNVVKQILWNYDEIIDIDSHTTELIRPGQDVRYAIDDSKLKALGWSPKAQFNVELEKIVQYYKNNFVW